jgi:hypothetical protein
MQDVTLTLTDREADIVRRALALYAEQGANGCTTECWNIRDNIIAQQVANDIEQDEYVANDGMTDAEADADTLASAGWGTDEDYGYYGGDDGF